LIAPLRKRTGDKIAGATSKNTGDKIADATSIA
jgi:hypothetical protein